LALLEQGPGVRPAGNRRRGLLASHATDGRLGWSTNASGAAWNVRRPLLHRRLAGRRVGRTQDRRLVRPEHAALHQSGHRARWALARWLVPLHRRVSLWQLAAHPLHPRLSPPPLPPPPHPPPL